MPVNRETDTGKTIVKQMNKTCRNVQKFIHRCPQGATIDEILQEIRIGDTTRFGVFGSKTLAAEGIVKAWNLGQLGSVTMVKCETRSRNNMIVRKIPTFYPEVAA